MEMLRVEFSVMAVFALVLAVVVPSIHSQSLVPEPMPAQAPAPGPTSDGVAIDQGVAYVLMLLALLLTYIIH